MIVGVTGSVWAHVEADAQGVPSVSNGHAMKPKINSVFAQDHVSVKVTFNKSVSNSALDVSNYKIDLLTIAKATFEAPNNNVVILTTDAHRVGTIYRLVATNVTDLDGNVIDPVNSHPFVWGPPPTKPKLDAIQATSRTVVQVTFDKEMDHLSALNTSNYTIKGLQVLRSSFKMDENNRANKKVVELTTSPNSSGSVYALVVSNVTDLSGNVIDEERKSMQFFGFLEATSTPSNHKMVQVGTPGVVYRVPEFKDENTVNVTGGYMIGTTEVTYDEWYSVRTWAMNRGYTFQNMGREGHDGKIGAYPTLRAKNEPVTTISWRDAIVWSNAKSEREGLTPVYRLSGHTILRNATHVFSHAVDDAMEMPNANGYRLPTSNEWGMAARWMGTQSPMTGSLARTRRTTTVNDVTHYWTPWNYASGAVEDASNESETGAVSWFWNNALEGTRPVGQKRANALGLYDMSGNVAEWVFDTEDADFELSNDYRVIRGGSWDETSSSTEVSHMDPELPHVASEKIGFRISRMNRVSLMMQKVTQTELQMAIPRTGASAYTYISLPDQYASAVISWSPNIEKKGMWAGRFQSGQTYTATVTLTPKKGYTAQGLPANVFTVAGAQSVTHDPNSTVITITYAPTARTNAPEHAARMVQVGKYGVTYAVPIGLRNENNNVAGGFWIGNTEVSYAEWYAVRMWAIANGYTFENMGVEGHDGIAGAAPMNGIAQEPVTSISWRDAIVWSNAKSEREGLIPVYRSRAFEVLRSFVNAQVATVEATMRYVQSNGYRLPTSQEWEMAARWLGTSQPKKGSLVKERRVTRIHGASHFWTPAHYASGATESTAHATETSQTAWYADNSNNGTKAIGSKRNNALGLFDMNGNVAEWVFDAQHSSRVAFGGSWIDEVFRMRTINSVLRSSDRAANNIGLRIARSEQ